MDKEELKIEILKFLKRCEELKRPVKEYCLNAAYPGDSSTSYLFDIKADWVGDECFSAISIFTDVMFETMSEEARRKIFSIRVFTDNEELHCDSGEIISLDKKVS